MNPIVHAEIADDLVLKNLLMLVDLAAEKFLGTMVTPAKTQGLEVYGKALLVSALAKGVFPETFRVLVRHLDGSEAYALGEICVERFVLREYGPGNYNFAPPVKLVDDDSSWS